MNLGSDQSLPFFSYMRLCQFCSKEFTPHKFHPHQKTCSKECCARQEYLNNKDRYLKQSAEFYKNNKDKDKIYQKRWNERHPEQRKEMDKVVQQRRDARIKNLGGIGLTVLQWRKICSDQNYRCYWCGEKKDLTIDHVIPVSKGGIHDPLNIVGACGLCNSRKKDFLWDRSLSVLEIERKGEQNVGREFTSTINSGSPQTIATCY